MTENALINKAFFAYAHIDFRTYTIGVVKGCVAPGWFLVDIDVGDGATPCGYTKVVSIENMKSWCFFSTPEEAVEYKDTFKKAQLRRNA